MSILFRGASESRAISAVPWSHGEDSPASMSQDRALSVVPVYAAIRLISDSIATMPLHCYSRRPDGSRSKTPLPSSLRTPVGGGTTVDFVQRGLVSALLHGNAFGLKTGNERGWPSGVTWLRPDLVGRDKDGWTYQGRHVDDDEMLHIPAVVVPGERRGVSPIAAFAATFDGASESQNASRSWAKKRAVPGLKLRNTQKVLSATEADTIGERVRAKVRTGEPFVTGMDWDLDVLSIPSGDLAFLESIRAGATQVASIYGLPAESIGGSTGASLTYNTVEQQTIQILTFALRPWMVRFEQHLSQALMPRPQYVKFNADSLIRTDTMTRYQIHQIARNIGLRNVDEIRVIEDEDPLPNGEGASYAPLALKAPPTTSGDGA